MSKRFCFVSKKQVICFISIFLWLNIVQSAFAQQITWGEIDDHDEMDMPFDIIGKFDSVFLVFKSVRKKNYITVYDEEMQIIQQHELEFLPAKMLDISIIKNKHTFTLVWQEQKNGVINCFATVLNAAAQTIVPTKLVDTTLLNKVPDKNIYLTASSEDKSKLLIYKRYVNKGEAQAMFKIFDSQLHLQDSSRFNLAFNSKKDYLSACVIDNEGSVYFTTQHRSENNKTYTSLELFSFKKNAGLKQVSIPLIENRLLQTSLIIDNAHKRCVITSDYSQAAKYRSDGKYLCITHTGTQEIIQQQYIAYSDSVKSILKPSGGNIYDEEDYHPDFILVKKNGGIVIVKEDAYQETVSMLNPMANSTMMGYPGVYSPTDYYYSPYQSSFYNRNFTRSKIRYYHNNIHLIQIDSSLQNHWVRVISKNQQSDEEEDFNSYFLLIQPKELHVVYLNNPQSTSLISHVGISIDGLIHRYPTFRRNEQNHALWIRYSKQVKSNQFISPYVSGRSIGFAKIELTK